MERKSYYEDIEWEMLKCPLEFYINNDYNLTENNINILKVSFERNEEYDIIRKFDGNISIEEIDKLEKYNDIDFNKVFKIESKHEKITFKYERRIYIEKVGQNYTITFYVTNLEKEVHSPQKISWISEWYLNGPHMRFNRVTEYVNNEDYTKKRMIGFKPIIEQKFDSQKNVMSTIKNYLYISPENSPHFIISKVPSEFNPKWSNNISIEYYDKFDFPDDKSKQLIFKILSYFWKIFN